MGFIQDYLTFVGVMAVLALVRYSIATLTTKFDKFGNVKIEQAKAPEGVNIVEKIKRLYNMSKFN